VPRGDHPVFGIVLKAKAPELRRRTHHRDPAPIEMPLDDLKHPFPHLRSYVEVNHVSGPTGRDEVEGVERPGAHFLGELDKVFHQN